MEIVVVCALEAIIFNLHLPWYAQSVQPRGATDGSI